MAIIWVEKVVKLKVIATTGQRSGARPIRRERRNELPKKKKKKKRRNYGPRVCIERPLVLLRWQYQQTVIASIACVRGESLCTNDTLPVSRHFCPFPDSRAWIARAIRDSTRKTISPLDRRTSFRVHDKKLWIIFRGNAERGWEGDSVGSE